MNEVELYVKLNGSWLCDNDKVTLVLFSKKTRPHYDAVLL